MSHLETAMAILMQTFDKYATVEGNKCTLNKGELKTMMEAELPSFMKGAKNPDEVDKMMKALDYNGDAEVDFSEFVVFVAAMTCACHDRMPKK
ncbi:protein S100-P-like [Denticeps clupeoides]|uniref:EF-hand domain-containing protein n=1 Tax=Denticeps clupeoides TaxID=299321 RepID=A0AAY4CY15_9TELE|nr:protein S100-P [Denticeps clupeoides]